MTSGCAAVYLRSCCMYPGHRVQPRGQPGPPHIQCTVSSLGHQSTLGEVGGDTLRKGKKNATRAPLGQAMLRATGALGRNEDVRVHAHARASRRGIERACYCPHAGRSRSPRMPCTPGSTQAADHCHGRHRRKRSGEMRCKCKRIATDDVDHGTVPLGERAGARPVGSSGTGSRHPKPCGVIAQQPMTGGLRTARPADRVQYVRGL
ncbi:hypothetical protein BD309DRAFT_241148 [Dichomitus squalens]|nr:hypothetical protein BD309DRAFT_241148 [Dichomitus squalens]